MVMRAFLNRVGAVASAALLLTAAAACGSGGDASNADPATDPAKPEQSSSSGVENSGVESSGAEGSGAEGSGAEGDGDYAFGTDRDQIAQAIEEAFSTQNGTARWEGDTLVLSLDEEGPGVITGFRECRVLDGLLREEDAKVVEFPSGRVDCAEVLGAG